MTFTTAGAGKKASCIARDSTHPANALFTPSLPVGGYIALRPELPGWGTASSWMLQDWQILHLIEQLQLLLLFLIRAFLQFESDQFCTLRLKILQSLPYSCCPHWTICSCSYSCFISGHCCNLGPPGHLVYLLGFHSLNTILTLPTLHFHTHLYIFPTYLPIFNSIYCEISSCFYYYC